MVQEKRRLLVGGVAAERRVSIAPLVVSMPNHERVALPWPFGKSGCNLSKSRRQHNAVDSSKGHYVGVSLKESMISLISSIQGDVCNSAPASF